MCGHCNLCPSMDGFLSSKEQRVTEVTRLKQDLVASNTFALSLHRFAYHILVFQSNWTCLGSRCILGWLDPNWHHSMIVGFSGLMQPNHWGTVQLGPPKMLLFLIGIHLPKKDRFMLILNGCNPARDWLTVTGWHGGCCQLLPAGLSFQGVGMAASLHFELGEKRSRWPPGDFHRPRVPMSSKRCSSQRARCPTPRSMLVVVKEGTPRKVKL